VTSTARIFKVENRLAKTIQMPGGRTVVEALRAADKRVGRLKDQCLVALQSRLISLSRLSAEGRAGNGREALSAIYTLADEIIGLTGAADLKELGTAANSLCDLVDHFRTAGPANWPAIEVHIGALHLLSSPGRDEDERQRILEGLHKVSARFAGPSMG
jgi:hypothetical protein